MHSPISEKHNTWYKNSKSSAVAVFMLFLYIDWVFVHKPTEPPRKTVKTLTRQPVPMGLLPDTLNRRLCMRPEYRERFLRHRLPKKITSYDPGMHHGTCVVHVPWCMSGSLTRGDGEKIPGIPGAWATHNFTYLAKGPCWASTHPTDLCMHWNLYIYHMQ